MVYATSAAVASLAALALLSASTSEAAPLEARAGSCDRKTLFNAAIGFNGTATDIYVAPKPAQYLTFDNAAYDTNGLPVLSYRDANTVSNPETFEFVSCKFFPAEFQGKGAINKWQGYIKTNDGQCLHAKELGQTTHLEKKPCLLDNNTPTGVAYHQSFQFASDTFFDYYDIQFLGKDQSPVSSLFEGAYHPYSFSLRSNNLGDNLQLSFGQRSEGGSRDHQLMALTGTTY